MDRSRTPDLRKVDDYRKYMATIDRVLATFESIESWPDNIAFLNRLLKTIQSHTGYPLPRSFEVSNCLSLCLASGLPSGVHQKALEVYSYILSSKETLEREVSVFLTGLMPVLSYASTTVKQAYTTLISTFIIPLGSLLSSHARGLVLALLPGIEDEHDDFFDICIQLIDELKAALGDDTFFWSSFWLATVSTTSGLRLGSLNYLSRRMPKILHLSTDPPEAPAEDGALVEVLGPDPSLLVSAFSRGLTDANSLVQRGFLELLLTTLPLSSRVVKILSAKQRRLLLSSATQIVLRRDVSLNRRLWTWLTTSSNVETTIEERMLYFQVHVKEDLIAALLDNVASDPARTNRLLLSLLDRDDIGGQVIQSLFPAIMHSIYRNTGHQSQEVLNSAIALFESVSIDIILDHIANLCTSAQFDEVDYMFTTFNFTDEIISDSKLSSILLYLLHNRSDHSSAMNLACKIVHRFVEPSMMLVASTIIDADLLAPSRHPIKNAIAREDVSHSSREPLGHSWPMACFRALSQHALDTDVLYEILVHRYHLGFIDEILSLNTLNFLTQMIERHRNSSMPFGHVQGLSRLVQALQPSVSSRYIYPSCSFLFEQCWNYLGATKLKYEISAIRTLENLCSDLPAEFPESFISNKVAGSLRKGRSIDKFEALWQHLSLPNTNLLRKSTLLILDTLTFDDQATHSYILRWLRTSHDSAPRIIYFLLEDMNFESSDHNTVTQKPILEADTVLQIDYNYDLRALSYRLKLLRTLVGRLGTNYLRAFDLTPVASVNLPPGLSVFTERNGIKDFVTLFSQIAMRCLQVRLECEDEKIIFALCDECFGLLKLTSINPGSSDLEILLARTLAVAVDRNHPDVVHLTLEMLVHISPEDKHYFPLSHELLQTLAIGISRFRGDPILQDYLTYLRVRINVEDQRESESIVSLSHCIAEQIDLNLIDIDAVLTTENSPEELNTAHDNILLYLDALDNLGQSLFEGSVQKSNHTTSTSTDTLATPLGGRFQNTLHSNRAWSVNSNEPDSTLRRIVWATSGVWLWSSNNVSTNLLSIKYICKILKTKAESLLLKIARRNLLGDIFDLLLALWTDSTDANRTHLEALSRILLPGILNLACQNVKSRLSFSPVNARQVKEVQANFSMLFSIALLSDAASEDFASNIAELIVLLRHLTLHMPLLAEVQTTLLCFVALVSSQVLKTVEGQQKKNKREVSDLVTKIINSVTTVSMDDQVRKVLSCQIVPDLPRIFLDSGRTAVIVATIMNQNIAPHFKTRTVDIVTLELLEAVVQLEGVRKAWKKDVQDFFSDAAFFETRMVLVGKWMAVLRVWLETDKEKINEYITKPSPSTPGHLFSTAETERQVQSQQVRRLTFLVLAMPLDAFLTRLSTIELRLSDLLSAGILLQTEALNCMQAIFLRISDIHLRTFWPRVVIELQKVFHTLIEDDQVTEESEDLWISALHTIDLLLYQCPGDFQP